MWGELPECTWLHMTLLFYWFPMSHRPAEDPSSLLSPEENRDSDFYFPSPSFPVMFGYTVLF